MEQVLAEEQHTRRCYAGRQTHSDDFSSDSWVAMVSAISCPKRPAQWHAGTLCLSQDFKQGPQGAELPP